MKNLWHLFLLILYIKYDFVDCIVHTQEGAVRGVERTSRKGRKFVAFYGIPYAEPPVGPLRFKSPVPKKAWNGTLNAYKYGKECIHLLPNSNATGSEDCLCLNVFTPQLQPKSLLPVMVYITGGGFRRFTPPNNETGPEFLLDKDVILVTFAYRLGILGFLSTGDKAAPGNAGLKDQRLVLQWVQRNIRNFGGDPDEVTLFGQSAGGFSISLHTVAETSKHLFKRYITQSGNALSPKAFNSHPSYYDNAKKVGELFNCTTSNSSLMIECLQAVNAEELVTNSMAIFSDTELDTFYMWLPCKELESSDAFLSDTPANLIRHNKLKDAPCMTGNVKDDGTVAPATFLQSEELYQKAINDTTSLIKQLLQLYEPARGTNLTELSIKMKNFYIGPGESYDNVTVLRGLTFFVSDLYFLYPEIQLANYLRNSSKERVYLFEFTYLEAITRNKSLNLGDDIVAHGDDLFYLFFFGEKYNMTRTQQDYKMVDVMVDLWTSFAINSIPISNQLTSPDLWQPYSSGTHLQIGNITEAVVTVSSDFFEERMNFWYSNVPQYSL